MFKHCLVLIFMFVISLKKISRYSLIFFELIFSMLVRAHSKYNFNIDS